MMGFEFEKLEVYQKAIELAKKIYHISRRFPENEIYGLRGQLRRAVVSVSANIAEGSGRYHKNDFIQFLRIARGSIYECVPLLEICANESFIDSVVHQEIKDELNTLAKIINGLIRSLKADK